MAGLPSGSAPIHGRRGQPGRPSAGLSASERYVRRGTRPALAQEFKGSGPGRAAWVMWPVRHSGGVRTRPAPGSIPDTPGSYQFVDAAGRVLYVGKAKSLRSRLTNYFGDPSTLPPRTAQMVAVADHVEWIQVANDKSYPWMAVTLADDWPRAAVVRGRRRPGVRYFGPYAHVGAIRDTLDLLLRTFPIRSCSDAKLERHVKMGKPCLLYHIERCSARSEERRV